MKEQQLTTQFIVMDNTGGDNYIYSIPTCQMFRLHKGDALNLYQYNKGFPNDRRESWVIEVIEEPTFEINWSRGDPDNTAYDIDSVIPRQVVRVRVKSPHTYI